ncbi:MAG: hypothetical protein IH971_08675, partial [Candidatus Marinimicrobia bacterium]|nr:hypothetical protein [Candidatus Neomarinimicrobiota bacterium]
DEVSDGVVLDGDVGDATGASVLAAEGFSGKVFFHYTYDTVKGASHGRNEFALSRVYLTYQKAIADDIKVRLTTDVDRTGSAWTVFQKIAAVQWDSPWGEIIIGLQGMNLWNVSEANWGYRFVEKTPMDRHRFASSADMGIGFKRTFGQRLHLHATLTNGPGFRKVENDRFKRLATQVVYGATNLGTAAGYNWGVTLSLEPEEVLQATGTVTEIKPLWTLFGGLSRGRLRVGAEFDRYTDTWIDSPRTQQILAAYANLQLRPTLALFGRVDFYHADTSAGNSTNEELFVILGVNYAVAGKLHIAPNVRLKNADFAAPDQIGLSAINLSVEFKY